MENEKENNKVYIKPFIILFLISIVIFAIMYFLHSKNIENRFNITLQNYEKSINLIFENAITNNGSNENIYSTKEYLKLSFEVGFKMLESSINEIMKNSNDILQFWFAFLSVIMIVFTIIGFFLNNNILENAKKQLEMVEKEARTSRENIEKETNKLIEENNKNINITNLFNMSNQADDNRNYNLSINYLTEIIKIYEDDFNNKKYDEKSDNYDKAKKNCAVAYNNRGNAKSDLAKAKGKNNEEYDKLLNDTVEDYNKAIELYSNYYQAYYNRALSKEKLQLLSEAIYDYDIAIGLKDNSLEAYNNRGIVKSKLGNYKEAIEDFNKAIELNPNYSEPYDNRGTVKSKLGNYKEATEDFNKAIELNPNYYKAYSNRADSKINLGKYEEALKDLNQAIKIKYDYANAYFNIGEIKYKQKKYKEAIKNFGICIEFNTKDAEAYYKRGEIKLVLAHKNKKEYNKLTEEAIKDFIKAYESNNNNEAKENSKNQLISLAKQGYEEAIEFCEENDIDYKN
ncbi:tetratricopeptide repeat protein [Brachyspira aalborgi]|uniref:Tetratricopeptide repeat protein n=1 Tax=Brachyspira aalborgi TaxID=29522 RepID=A0A5C8CCF6_9SPIR|nr:tetratricopeptide repeat protein [Brachyspira aalborgi]TXJ11149.1 tetratricopeptide repeat protein [Brachyspira aalborgi]